jgi:hypothetical protein
LLDGNAPSLRASRFAEMSGTLRPVRTLDSRGGGSGVEVPTRTRDAQYWLDRAEEARLQAEEMTYADSRREMLKVAAGYRLLANLAGVDATDRKQRSRLSQG